MARLETERADIKVSLENDRNRFVSAESDFKQEIQTLSEQLTARTNEITSHEAKLAELAAQAQVLTNDNADLATQAEELKKQNADLVSQMAEFDAKLLANSNMSDDLVKRTNELVELNNVKQQELDVMTDKFETENKSLLEKVNLITDLESRVNELSSEREAYLSEKSNWSNQLEELNQQLTSTSRANEQLTNERSNAALLTQQVNSLNEKCQT
jgi:chromosome segregation ATPase